MTEREKLLDRILKLHRKAVSAREIGSEAEAMLFAEHVEKLLTKHKLELSDIELEVQEKMDPVKFHYMVADDHGIGAKANRLWYECIAQECARTYYCEALMEYRSANLFLVGRRQDRQICEFMIVTLTRLAQELADKAYTKAFYQARAEGDVAKARGFRANFLLGFGMRVGMRYQEMREARERNNQHNPHALIRLSKETALVKQVADKLREAVGEKEGASQTPRKIQPEGLVAGIEAGNEVNLNPHALYGGSSGPKQVGPGQKLLKGGE